VETALVTSTKFSYVYFS